MSAGVAIFGVIDDNGGGQSSSSNSSLVWWSWNCLESSALTAAFSDSFETLSF